MRFRSAIGCALVASVLNAEANARQGSTTGTWAPGFNHPTNSIPGWPSTFEAINLAVIPLLGTGGPSNPGKVIVFDSESANSGTSGSWTQRFAVGSPESGAFDNFMMAIPAGFGDIFCSGHVWMPNGRLFVAGGTTKYSFNSLDNFLGSRFVGIWDPNQPLTAPDFGWTFVCDPAGQNKPMQVARWYPTVTLLGNNQIMVAGGVEDTDPLNHTHDVCNGGSDAAVDTYEILDIALNNWVPGPLGTYEGPEHGQLGTCFSMFGEYPRQHLLSSGHLFVVGMFRGANHVHHATNAGGNPLAWLQDPPATSLDTGMFRNYGSSVLIPNLGRRTANEDMVMIIGGSQGGATVASNTCQVINGYNGTPWSMNPALNVGRMVANTVLLPDGAILEVGGCTGIDYHSSGSPQTPEFRPEIYRKSVNAWTLQSPQVSPRMYHSTAALLPSGNVVSAGGDIRTWDYEVFTPDYLSSGQTRPAFAGTIPSSLAYNTLYAIPFTPMPPGLHVDRVVLMAPCSVTHHSDMHQRYVELEEPFGTLPPPNTINIRTPLSPNPSGTTQGSVMAARGWYMMFLVSNTGTPSIAKWVQLQ